MSIAVSEDVPSQTEAESSSEMWLNLSVSGNHARKETIMWDHVAKYLEQGNQYIGLLHDTKWFRGWDGLPDGCTLKPVTAAAFTCCVKTEE